MVIETTAHTIAGTLALLAFDIDLQDEIFEHIIAVIGHDPAPVGASDTSLGLSNSHQAFRFTMITQSLIKL